jgi:hypothetical protein
LTIHLIQNINLNIQNYKLNLAFFSNKTNNNKICDFYIKKLIRLIIRRISKSKQRQQLKYGGSKWFTELPIGNLGKSYFLHFTIITIPFHS